MTIRAMLFLLFLYTLLVWIVSAYLGGDFVRLGLFWTGAGVAALLAWLICERILAWWRLRRARKTASPPQSGAAVKTSIALHPDDAALRQLVDEANSRLAQAEAWRGTGATLFDLPLFLVLGSEGSGKTAVIQNSGVEAHLLAGQAMSGGEAPAPTRVANIWLAQKAIYLEVSGRIFAGDLTRFSEWLRELAPKQQQTGIQRRLAGTRLASLLAVPQRPGNLRGVILVSGLKEFIGEPESARHDRAASLVRDRLDAVAAHFGTRCPVYVLFTRCDQITYFREFFGRMSENESAQPFGALAGSDEILETPGQAWADAETKRLNRYYNQIFLCLSNRRLLALTNEPKLQTRPAVYEFPREFKKVRTPLVRYLVDIFRPSPLKVAPQLRGFFFTGTRMVERTGGAGREASSTIRGGSGDAGATMIFRPGATEVFSYGSARGPEAAPGGAKTLGWMFLADLFHKVLLRDRPALTPLKTPAATVPVWTKGAMAAAALVGTLFALTWTFSWFGNRTLIADVRAGIEAMNARPSALTVDSLRPMDQLRQRLEAIETGDSWRLHWGLYSGGEILKEGQRAYFRRAKTMFLDGANMTLLAGLTQPGAGSLYDRLKTQVTISKKACAVDVPLVKRVLEQAVRDWKPNQDAEPTVLVQRQIDYYVRILRASETPPVILGSDAAAIAAAQGALQTAYALEPQLNVLLNQVAKRAPNLNVAERVPGYAKVMSGPSEFPGQFTKAGAAVMESLIDSGDWGGAGEECVTGKSAGLVAGVRQSAESKSRLRELYFLRYAEAWRGALRRFRVLPFNGVRDAAAKLDLLSGSQSPLLTVIKVVADNTNFSEKAGEVSKWDPIAQKLGLGSLVAQAKKGEKRLERVEQIVSGPAGLTAADVTKLMQPVHVTTPPTLPVLVSEGNQAYVMGLRGLQQSLDKMSRGTEADVVALIPEAQQALAQAKMGLKGLADRFANTGNQDLNVELTNLLDQPIRWADAVIPRNPVTFSAGKLNGDLAAMCRQIGQVLSKYPFNAQSSVDVLLTDVVRAFGPATGAVWQFQQNSLADLAVRQGPAWVQAKPKPRLTAGLLAFLDRAQQLTDVLFPGGNAAAQPRLSYILRGVPGSPGVRLTIDGKEINTAASNLQVEFGWPATSPSQAGAEGNVILPGNVTFPFGSYPGQWAVFHLFQNADDRAVGDKRLQWSRARGPGGATLQPFNPPAKLEFVQFPGGVDLFNPRFFDALRCPSQAVIPE